MSGAGGTVYVVDDNDHCLQALVATLRARGFAVAPFLSARGLLDALPEDPQGCLLLDVRMPQMDGLALQAELGARGVFLPIVFLTGFATVEDGVWAMKAGAVDFLQKPAEESRLLAALTAALGASRREAESRRERAELARRLASLTPREREVFALVGKGLRNKETAERLGIAEKTVKVHRARVMQKLDLGTLADLVLLSQKLPGTIPP